MGMVFCKIPGPMGLAEIQDTQKLMQMTKLGILLEPLSFRGFEVLL